MRVSALFSILVATAASSASAFVPAGSATFGASKNSALHAKYNTMDEILAKFPDDKPVLINFYDGNTEDAIKKEISQTKNYLKDRATLVSIKRQDYPELAKLWDADQKSPAMILFKDGTPVVRLYEQTFCMDIAAKISKYCEEE